LQEANDKYILVQPVQISKLLGRT